MTTVPADRAHRPARTIQVVDPDGVEAYWAWKGIEPAAARQFIPASGGVPLRWSPEAYPEAPTFRVVNVAADRSEHCELGGYDPERPGHSCQQRGWIEVDYQGERRWGCSRHVLDALSAWFDELAYEITGQLDVGPQVLDLTAHANPAVNDMTALVDRVTTDYDRLTDGSTDDVRTDRRTVHGPSTRTTDGGSDR